MEHFYESFAFSLGEYKAVWTDAFVFFPMMSARCFLTINDPVILLETELTFFIPLNFDSCCLEKVFEKTFL